MAKLSPYLFCENAKEQADFYIKALGGEVVRVQTYDEMPDPDPKLEGRIMHLVLQAAGVQFFLADDVKEDVTSGTQIDLALEFPSKDEAEKAFEGLAVEGHILMPFEKMFWGAHFGRLEDRFGVRWQIAVEE